REEIGKTLRGAGLRPRMEVSGRDQPEPWMESLFWRNGNRYCLAVLKNVMGSADGPDAMKMIEQDPKEIMIRLNFTVKEVRNLRTGKIFGDVSTFKDSFNPWEANLYEFASAK